MSLEECLPEHLRGPSTRITPLGARATGASVYRVDAASGSFVLKVAGAGEASVEGDRSGAMFPS